MLFWIMMALTSLTKGLLGFALPCLVCFVYSTARRFDTLLSQPGALSKVKECLRANEWFFQWQSVVAIPLALLTYLAPFLISAFWFGDFEGLGMVWRENIRRFYNPVNHIGPMYLYFVVIFTLMAPWSVFLPAALTQAIFGKKSPKPIQQNHLFALCYFLSVFIFFTLASSRRSYYLLPILPSAAWLIAGLISSDRAFLNKTVRFLLNLAIVFMILASVGLLFPVFPGSQVLPQPWNQFPALPQGWFLVVTSLVVITCLVLSLLKPVRVSPFFGVAAFAFLIMVYLFHLYYPWAESFRTQREFASRVRSLIGEKVESLSYYRTREAVFYLDMAGPVQEFYTPETLLSAVAGGKTRWVILKKQEIQRIPKSVNILVEEPSFPWEGSQASSKLALVEFSN